MDINWIRIALLGSFLLSIAGCNQARTPALLEETLSPATNPPVAATQTEPETDGAQTQMTPTTQPFPSSGMEFLVEKAKEDLAQRLSISVIEIDLIEAKAVTWPNASLGCPQPGMVYAEVLTPGYLILLNTDNEEYEYHASRSTEVIYCENPRSPVPGTPDDI
jgi:hypothetical protein